MMHRTPVQAMAVGTLLAEAFVSWNGTTWDAPCGGLPMAAHPRLSVWLFAPRLPLRQDLLRPLLDDAEMRRLEAFRFARDHDDYLAAHGALRLLLGAALDEHPAQVRFSTGSHGKPRVEFPATSPGFGFNLSHTHGLYAIAFGYGGEIGIDVELTDRLADPSLPGAICTVAERAALVGLDESARRATLARWWCRKEAYLKGLGLGLSIIPTRVDMLDDDSDVVRVHLDQQLTSWRCVDLATPVGCAAAVAWNP